MRTIGVLIRAHLRERRHNPEIFRLLPSSGSNGKTCRLTKFKNGGQTAFTAGPIYSPGSSGYDQINGVSDLVNQPARSVLHSWSKHQMCNFRLIRFQSFHSTSRSERGSGREWVTYDPQAFSLYYRYRPFQVAYRAMIIISEMVLLSIGHVVEKDIQKRAEKLRRSLIRLGAFYIKLGQALSTRPDILPNAYCQELAKLQDHVPPYPTSVALDYLESQLGSPASKLYAYITPEPVAAASLGQVYKALLHSGELVAVKVQRPGVTACLALDAHLLGLLGGPLQRFAGARSDLLNMINEMVERMFEEVDYVLEGQHAERFNKLYGINQDDVSKIEPLHGLKRISLKGSESKLEGAVKVPKVYWDLTSKGVLTMEWVDGIKLTDNEALRNANLDTQQLVDQGVFCSLRQLLEEGFFHADPHPGNLVVTKEGLLAYFDFGMMSEVRKEYRIGLIRTIVHFVNRDSLGLAKDFMVLGFIPENSEIAPIAEALRGTFGVEGTKTQLDFQGIMAQLSDVMYQFKFRLPAEFAMIIRALGSLEGTATTVDPHFKVVASAYPFIVGRLLADPDPDMREILRELLIRNNGSIRWHRLERLVFAIAEQSISVSENETKTRTWSGRDGLGQRAAVGINGAFNTRAVASATMDIFNHILSGKGVRIRTILVQDITQSFDHLLRQSFAKMLNVNEVFMDLSSKTAAQDPSAHLATEKPSNQELLPKQTWSDYTSAYYWNKLGAKRRAETKFSLKIGRKREEHMGTQGVDVDSFVEILPDDGSTDGQKSDTTKEEHSTSSDGLKLDDFSSRLKVGFQAFANACNSAPEVWIPLMTRLAFKPEASSLAADILSSLEDVYRRRTSEASFLLMSKALHRNDIELQRH